MESLTRLCLLLEHSTPNAYCPLSLRGRRLGVRLVMAVVPQPTSSRGSSSRGKNLFIVAIMRQSVTQGSGGCKVGFRRFARRIPSNQHHFIVASLLVRSPRGISVDETGTGSPVSPAPS